jgi:O-antigen ligase
VHARLSSLGRALPLVAVALSLLLVVPTLEHPFHAPKTLALLTLGGLGLLLVRRFELASWLPLLALGLSVAFGDASLPWPALTQLGFCVALGAWSATGVDLRRLERVASWAGALAAAVVLAQAAGLDLFAPFTPETTGRLRLYGTLGNPDFVASALSVTAWLGAGRLLEWARGPRAPVASFAPLLLLGVQLGALLVTRSFATVLALAVGLVVFAVSHRSWRVLAVGAAAVLVLALGTLGRELENSARGRWYLVKVAAPHLIEAPLLGHGPGAVETLWPQWEVDWWSARCGDAACVRAHPDGGFTGVQDHVHLDWLERALEQGLLGLVALGLVLARAVKEGPAHRRAALVTLAVRALFDFPLARPADLALLAALLSVR